MTDVQKPDKGFFVTIYGPDTPMWAKVWWTIFLFFGSITILAAIGPVLLLLAVPIVMVLIICLAVYGLVQDKQDGRWWLAAPLLIAGVFLALIGKASMKSVFDEED